jgi:hypothetical protein
MALYDGLPLDTPTKVFDDGADLELWATRTANGGTVEQRTKPGGPTATLNTKRAQVHAAVATLRQWSIDADAVTVTPGNAVATLQTTMDRLSVFFDRFADLIESEVA